MRFGVELGSQNGRGEDLRHGCKHSTLRWEHPLPDAETAHLIRSTLQAEEERLSPLGIARVHRTRLVNLKRIVAIAGIGT